MLFHSRANHIREIKDFCINYQTYKALQRKNLLVLRKINHSFGLNTQNLTELYGKNELVFLILLASVIMLSIRIILLSFMQPCMQFNVKKISIFCKLFSTTTQIFVPRLCFEKQPLDIKFNIYLKIKIQSYNYSHMYDSHLRIKMYLVIVHDKACECSITVYSTLFSCYIYIIFKC